MKVPLDCRPALKKKELKYSLKTHCVYTGRQHIASILHTTSDIFNRIRQGAYAEFKAEELNKVLKERIKKAILSSTAFRLTRDNFDHTHSDHTQKPIAKISVLPVDIGSSVVDTESLVNQKPIVVDTNLLGEKVTQATFTDLQYSFFKEKELSEGWLLKTKEDHASVFSLFVEVFGDLPLVEINKTTMRDFKATLVQLPPNMRKDARYRDKTVPEIIRMNPSATFSAHTINKYLSRMSNMFTYAVSHGYMHVNPASGLKVKLKTRPDEERPQFTTEDLRKLFRENEHRYEYCRWTPLIALYSGCRLEEICQLHLGDIRQDSGDNQHEPVWVIDINDKEEKRVKTASSVRLVPIHPKLVDEGLLEYVEKLRARGEKRLFPELKQRRDGYGQTVSKWYQRYKARCGIEDGKTFHSFRHTFITHLKHKQVDPFMIHELDGHAIASETMGRYGKRYTADILLREAVLKLDYGI